MMINKQELPPVILGQRKFGGSIPSGRISQYGGTEIPIINKKGTLSQFNPALSMHNLTDPNMIDQKLRSLSHGDNDARSSLDLDKKDKANLKFLRYKFHPGDKNQIQEGFAKKPFEQYGQLKNSNHKISINDFSQAKNVLFQDDRAPLVYKRLFLLKQHPQ